MAAARAPIALWNERRILPKLSRLALCSCLLALMPVTVVAQETTFNADGYRTARYRSPVDADIAPAQRISMYDALALEPGKDALFLDVMPTEGAVRDPATGTWRLSERHETIPGSQWHPETGRAPVEPLLWSALEQAIVSARDGRPELPVVIYCRADCWMSWNAARRLASSGFKHVYWLAEGTDGWHAAGRPLVDAAPVVVPARHCSEER